MRGLPHSLIISAAELAHERGFSAQQTLLSFAAVRCSGCFSDLCVSRQLLEVIDTDLKYRGEMLRYLGGILILLMIRHGLDGSDRTNKLEN